MTEEERQLGQELEHNRVLAETVSLGIAETMSTNPDDGARRCILYDVEARDWYDTRHGGVPREEAAPYTVAEAVALLTNGRPWPETRFLIEPEETRPVAEPYPASPSPYPAKAPPIHLTRGQCVEHLDVLKLKQCYIVYGDSYYKEPVGSGTTKHADKAVRATVPKALDLSSSMCTFELVDQELASQIFNTVSVVHILGNHLVDLLKLTPLNPTARAKVMAVMGQMPPTEADTWDKLQDWVKETPTPVKTAVKPEFTIALQFSDVETGRCHYSVTRRGRSDECVSLQDIARIIEEQDCDGVDRLVSELVEYVKEDAETPDMDWCDDMDYDDHDCNDVNDFSVTCRDSRESIAAQLTQYLQSNAPTETLRRLGL